MRIDIKENKNNNNKIYKGGKIIRRGKKIVKRFKTISF